MLKWIDSKTLELSLDDGTTWCTVEGEINVVNNKHTLKYKIDDFSSSLTVYKDNETLVLFDEVKMLDRNKLSTIKFVVLGRKTRVPD